MTQITYWAHFKSGRDKHRLGPFASREAAIDAAMLAGPKHKTLLTGYGSNGAHFDIRWHDELTNPYGRKGEAA